MPSIWQESFWLPEGVTWDDMKGNSTMKYPVVSHLNYTIPLGFALLVIRVLLESFVFLPIGWISGYVKTPLFSRIWTHLTGGFAGKTKFKRVAECAWRFTFFISAWIAGLFILWNEPQLKSVTDCWIGWPYHNISDNVWWYYIIETSFYWALFFGTLVLDIRRADFLQMMLHHGITLVLLYISWSMNMVRVGSLILFTHDAADIFIELAKIFRYAGWNTALNILFVIFLVIWIGTRLIYYPFWILYSIWFEAPSLIQASYRWSNVWQRPLVPRVLMVMLSLLLILHIFWTYVILKVAYKSVTEGEVDDIREKESDSEDDEDEKKKQ